MIIEQHALKYFGHLIRNSVASLYLAAPSESD
jgi:hypothetical protein